MPDMDEVHERIQWEQREEIRNDSPWKFDSIIPERRAEEEIEPQKYLNFPTYLDYQI
jgi:hypothetical protein